MLVKMSNDFIECIHHTHDDNDTGYPPLLCRGYDPSDIETNDRSKQFRESDVVRVRRIYFV